MKNFNPITIAKPCQKSWNDMTEATGGRYCNSCEKVVTDFTTMSNQEIIDFIAGRDRSQICGKFKIPQLQAFNQSLLIVQPKLTLWKRLAVAASLLICSVPFFKAEAKSRPSITMQPIVKWANNHETVVIDSVETITITGKIIAEDDKQPIPGVSVRTDNGKFGTITKMDGSFRLTIPANTKKINVAFIGYETQVIKIKSKNIKDGRIDITLKMSSQTLGGLG